MKKLRDLGTKTEWAADVFGGAAVIGFFCAVFLVLGVIAPTPAPHYHTVNQRTAQWP